MDGFHIGNAFKDIKIFGLRASFGPRLPSPAPGTTHPQPPPRAAALRTGPAKVRREADENFEQILANCHGIIEVCVLRFASFRGIYYMDGIFEEPVRLLADQIHPESLCWKRDDTREIQAVARFSETFADTNSRSLQM